MAKRVKAVRAAKKVGEGWLKPVVVGTAAGIGANQFPQAGTKKKWDEHKVKKSWPTEDGFNVKAAQEAYDLVMKMDEEDAREFTSMVVRDVLDDTIEQNLPVIQKRVNEVVSKCFKDMKRAALRTAISKRDEDGLKYAAAIRELEEITKAKTPYDYGYVFREQDFRRDPQTGRFQVKISHAQKKPLHTNTAKTIGINVDSKHYKAIEGAKNRAKYQDEYRQLAMFLDAVHASSKNPGDTDVFLHFRQDQTGQKFTTRQVGTKVPSELLAEPGTTLIGAEARPAALTVGGAAFGLSGALGHPMRGGEAVRGINEVERGMSQFAQTWTQPSPDVEYNSNEKTYRRLAAGSQYLGQIAPAGSKVQMAAKFGEFVGSHGPEAEQVFGPATRKAAYRYRGTERTPDSALIREYAVAINNARKREVYDPQARTRSKIAQTRAVNAKIRQIAEERNIPEEAVRLTTQERVEALNSVRGRATANTGQPTWEERGAGRTAIETYFRGNDPESGKPRMPRKGLYNLQLASGNVPPSEGVILNAQGQLVTQAIGYGDDHYLPFNLKHLKSLKGGEYIRTRSVGGPTSEDIYTGLMSGARQITVISRSGTFTVEFEPDFRGGRRYNDKARRMVRRYEQILDAVQSHQVERMDVDPEIRAGLTQMVRDRYQGLPVDRSEMRRAVEKEIDEFKKNPEISEQDEELARVMISAHTAGGGSPDASKIRGQIMNQIAAQKELKFRLNGMGYEAALQALQEQFPYYIKVNSVPTKEPERVEPEVDRGYVEPGRNRPTQALAGLYGVQRLPATSGGKFSAREADYQGGRRGSGGGGGLTPSPQNNLPPEQKKSFQEQVAERIQKQNYVSAAMEFQAKAREAVNDTTTPFTPEDLKDPAKQKEFDTWAQQVISTVAGNAYWSQHIADAKNKYLLAAGHLGGQEYNKESRGVWGGAPAKFDEPAFRPGASPEARQRAISEIDARSKSGVVYNKPLSSMTTDELQAEHGVLTRLLALREVADESGEKQPIPAEALRSTGVVPGLPGLVDLTTSKAIKNRIDDVHRMRSLLAVSPDITPKEGGTIIAPALKTSADYQPVRDKLKRDSEVAARAAIWLEDNTEDEASARKLHAYATALAEAAEGVHSEYEAQAVRNPSDEALLDDTLRRAQSGPILR